MKSVWSGMRIAAFTLLFAAIVLPVMAATASTASTKTTTPTGPVDLNTATEQQLVALPGIGEATAKKIIAGRPYSSVSDLSKLHLPASQLSKINPLVTVSSTPKTTTNTTTTPATSSSIPATPTTTTPATNSKSTKTTSAVNTPAAVPFQAPPAKGMVWVNLSTKVYHYEGDRYYGRTKNGKYMTEADAIKAGYHASKSKTSSSTNNTQQ